jgi:xanthine dehydrogenase YagR molybdenum-binding subunit
MMSLDEQSPRRLDAELKVTGAARYAAETAVEGLLHGALVTAPIPSGRVTRIDARAALSLAGVVAILTHENAPRLKEAAVPFLRLLQEPIVHFAGQPVALVIAETLVTARRAAEAVAVTSEELPAVTSVAQALDRAFAPKSAGRVPTDSRRGEPERALAEAEIVIEERYRTATNNHHPLEPQVAVASWERDHLVVQTATQAIFVTRERIAESFELPLDRVRVVSKYLGGGFGAKGGAWLPCLMLAVMASRQLGRPVKLELTRAEMFTLVGRRQETDQRVRLAATRDGGLTAIIHDTVAQTSAHGDYAEPTGTPARVLYACDNVATTHRLVRVNAPQPNPARAPGEGPGSFALESALDELAHRLDIDPLELRQRNYSARDRHVDLPWSSNNLRECYRVAARAFGWETRPRAPRSLRDRRQLVGWGMASACYPVYRMTSEAAVRVAADGAVTVRCGTQDVGGGTYTVLAQLAAAALGIPLDRVSVELGDTELPAGPYSGGSMATASFTPAVEEAARVLRRHLIELAAADRNSPLHGLAAEGVTIADGVIRNKAGNEAESISALLSRAAPAGLEARAHEAPEERPHYSSYGFGAVFAEVRVDPALGALRVTRLTAAYAAGRVLNPRLARSQFIGGLIGGIGMALHEATIMDQRLGRIVNDNLSDYLIPVHADMPQFDIHIVEEHDPHIGAGVKGIGMLGTVGTAAAIANALFHATGLRIRELPIRPEHCLPPA